MDKTDFDEICFHTVCPAWERNITIETHISIFIVSSALSLPSAGVILNNENRI